MSNQEVEVKILEINVEAVVAKLNQLKAKKIFDGYIKAEFFKNNEGQKIRLRKIDGHNILTFKKIIQNDEVRHNEEIEILFGEYESMKNLLTSIGFTQYGASEKHRVSYVFKNIHFEIDAISKIPTFLEIESNSIEEVKNGVELLGYDFSQTCLLTERTIKEHYGLA